MPLVEFKGKREDSLDEQPRKLFMQTLLLGWVAFGVVFLIKRNALRAKIVLFRGPRMGVWIRLGWVSRFWGAPIIIVELKTPCS